MAIYTTRKSTALSEAGSFESLRSTFSTRQDAYSHPLYHALPEKNDAIITTTYDVEESRFSSCSTSPNSSCESLDAFPVPKSSRLSAAPSALSAALSICSSNRSSRPASYASSRYADDHYPLITTLATAGKALHSSILDMAHAYNTYIRAINSCYNHAFTVEDEELVNFLFFNQTLYNILSQHLKVDQQQLRPLVGKPVVAPYMAGKSVSIHDDHVFAASFQAWATYIHDPATRQTYSGDELQAHISTFAPLLVQHLHAEVSQLNSLVNDDVLMPEHLSKIWSRFEKTLSAKLDLYTDAALLVGCHDRSFTVNGQRGDQKFPRLPLGTTTMVKKWHSRRHDGAWRYCSSDFSGKRHVIST